MIVATMPPEGRSQKKPRGDDSSSPAQLGRMVRDARDFIVQVLTKSKGTAYYADADPSASGLSDSNPWSCLSKEWQYDRGVLFVALQYEHVKVRDLQPGFWCGGPEDPQIFLLRCIDRNGNVWMGLPEELAADIRFAKAIRTFDKPLAIKILRKLPSLRQDREIWAKIINSNMGSLFDFLEAEADPPILLDKELMVSAVLQGGRGAYHKNLSRVRPSLLQNGDFADLLLERDPTLLPHLPHYVQLLFPRVIAKTFKPYFNKVGKENHVDLLWKLAPDLFQNRGVMRAWCAAGAPYDPHRQPRRWMNDEYILLLIAKHCSKRDAMESFRYASSKMLSDKRFMCTVVPENPWLFLRAAPDLAHDFDLAVLAFGTSKEFTEEHARSPRFKGFIERFQWEIDSRLKHYDPLPLLSIFCGMLVPADSNCDYFGLKQNPIHSSGIADIVGCRDSTGQKVLLKAAENLEATLGSLMLVDNYETDSTDSDSE